MNSMNSLRKAKMKTIISVLLNIFVAIESQPLTNEIPYVASVIYHTGPNRQEKVFAGVIISNVNILTSGHEASLIERAVCSGSEAALYDAWVAVEIDIDNRQNNELSEEVLPSPGGNRLRVVDLKLSNEGATKGPSPDIAVLTFVKKGKNNCFHVADYSKMGYSIEGEGYYGVNKIYETIGNHIHGKIKRKDFTLYETDVCNHFYNLDIANTQLCGIPKSETTFSEDDKGAGLLQENIVVGVAIYSKMVENGERSLQFVVFEKVSEHSTFIFLSMLSGLAKAANELLLS